MFLSENSVEGLLWGLKNFDGVELDVRVSKDNHVFLHHNPKTKNGTLIRSTLSSELRAEGLQEFHELLEHESFKHIITHPQPSSFKSLWIEVKHECKSIARKNESRDHVNHIATLILDELSSYSLPSVVPRFIGFSWKTLLPFVKDGNYKVMPILPNVNECFPSSLQLIMTSPAFFLHTLLYHGKKAKALGFSGILFSKNYVKGVLSKRHPSYESLLSLKTDDFELGMDVATIEEEEKFDSLHRFTDHVVPFPRYSKHVSTHIIAHRGVGKHGSLLPKESMSLMD